LKERRVVVGPEEFDHADIVRFSEKNSRYLAKVLRLKVGDRVLAFDGTREYLVRLVSIVPGLVRGEIMEVREPGKAEGPEITLAFGCIRPGPTEQILRHCTELGVSRFVPVIMSRCSRRPFERKERWKSIVSEAYRQSCGLLVPEVEAPILFDRFICRDDLPSTRILLSPFPHARPFLAVLDELTPTRLLILLGPEGGLDPAEESIAMEAGFSAAGLGPSVLRSETTAIAAVSMVTMWHDWKEALSTR
jgi:16S rRNA (uracil1498-N3)-methyltransferase